MDLNRDAFSPAKILCRQVTGSRSYGRCSHRLTDVTPRSNRSGADSLAIQVARALWEGSFILLGLLSIFLDE